ncbi:MAG TPA: hypothetical protein VER33_09590 [Polyangiaceae bacterium]|nr:hypothetical protein [Polyangiaceae bacterium]
MRLDAPISGVCAVALGFTLGCGSGDEDATCTAAANSTLSHCVTTYYFRDYEPIELPECDAERGSALIDERLNLQLFKDVELTNRHVAQHTRALQRYFQPQALLMQTRSHPSTYMMSHALRGTADEFERALLEAGIDPSASALSEEDHAIATRAVSDIMFREVIEFLDQQAISDEPHVDLVLIQQIVAPELADYLQLDGTLVGLGLSPTLLRRQAASSQPSAINSLLHRDDEFTPTVFLGHADIVRLVGQSDAVVAHELGHALGLLHWNEDGNLMAESGPFDCRRWLGEEQVGMMGPFHSPGAMTLQRRADDEYIPQAREFTIGALPATVVGRILRERSSKLRARTGP